MNSKITFHSDENANFDELSCESCRGYYETISKSARVIPLLEAACIASSIQSLQKCQGSVLMRILVILLAALLIVGLITLAVSVFTVH
jgi:hypothetical protein